MYDPQPGTSLVTIGREVSFSGSPGGEWLACTADRATDGVIERRASTPTGDRNARLSATMAHDGDAGQPG